MSIPLLPSMLKHENISKITENGILIRDRRKLPFSNEDVLCHDYREAAKAIKEMVTQGGGPLEVALNSLLFTWLHDREHLSDAVSCLSLSRPTNTTMKRTLERVMEEYSKNNDMAGIIQSAFDYYDALYDKISDIGESLIEDGYGVLTTCFPEHTFMLTMAKAKANGKRITVYVPETRPYLQGAHLTEPCLRELGIECYLITDGMPAHFMMEGRIQLYMTASDLVLEDRTVVNKTGTLSNAIAAKYYGIPYYAFSLSPDRTKTRSDIVIEYRDGESIKRIGSLCIAPDEAAALYPCFDIIEPSLVAGIITEGGII
ncbi:MAG: translation initiation factor 2 [Spirochaetes bacterium]|uniref:Translation initiation factor 2 n=1 Tax=Candidatus Ornithospirochaeta stercoripullorum TaxID=2840899 RepID=A0A9D9E1T2_9SPIO|nr:translation initiation factor 2 [Candidatus Ornithospirochaeta stercoripullorum]